MDEADSLGIVKKYEIDYVVVNGGYINLIPRFESQSSLSMPGCGGNISYQGRNLKYTEDSILYKFLFDSGYLRFYKLAYQNKRVRIFKVSV